jgi:CHAT domain-containing protein
MSSRHKKRALEFCVAIVLQLLGPACTHSPGQEGSSSDEDPDRALKQARHLADLYNWADAAPFFARAEELNRARGDARNQLFAHLGILRSTMEQRILPEISEDLAAELDTDPLMQSDKELRLFCLIVKGDIDGEIDATPMRRDWEEALQIATELGDAKWKNRASGEIGVAMFLQGDLTDARQRVAGALIEASALNDVGAQIRYLGAIGTGLVLGGSYDDAIGYFDRAEKLAQANPDAGYLFFVESGRVQALKAMNKLADAQRLADEIIRQARVRQKHVKEAQALTTAAKIARAAHDDDQAVTRLQSAIDLAESGGYKRLLIDAQLELADVFRYQGRIQEAKDLLSAATATTQQIGDLYLLPCRLQTLADLEVSQQEYTKADDTYDLASDILDTMIGNVTAVSAKSELITGMSDIYVRHFALLIDHLHDPAKAYAVVERARGRVITDLLMSGKRPDTPQEKRIERRIARLNLDLSRAKSESEVRRIRDRVFLAEQARWLTPGSGIWKSQPLQPVALAKVQRSLSVNDVLFEFVLADPQSYCLVITRNKVRAAVLPSRSTIDALVVDLLDKIKAKQSAPAEAGRVYETLFRDIPETRKEHWIVVPDGRLHLLPFDAVRDPTGRYLVWSHTITIAASATSMYLTNANSHLSPTNALLGVGGVSYNQNPDRGKLAATAGYVRGTLSNLPGSKEEVLAASAALPNPSNTLLLGSSATESAFKRAPLDRFSIIHLAVHGMADEKHPDHAALLLLSDPAAGEDGILQPSEIVQLHIHADLVVLSACDTAVGRLQGQEGIANISRAFVLAGARNVISTLWGTDDIFSSYLMKKLYARLAAKATIASALTGAKRDVLKMYGKEAVPYYWASFTLEGLGNYSIDTTNATRRAHGNAKVGPKTELAHTGRPRQSPQSRQRTLSNTTH